MDRRTAATLLLTGLLIAATVPVGMADAGGGGEDGAATDGDAGAAVPPDLLPAPWSHLDVDPAKARLLRGVLDGAGAHGGSGPAAGMAVAEAALSAKRAEVGATLPANLSAPLDQQLLNLRTARDLLGDGTGSDDDTFLHALRDARAGQAWMVEAGGFEIGSAPTEPAHATPSAAAKALVDRFGLDRSVADDAELETLDALPDPVPGALTAWIDAYLRLEAATGEAFASADPSSIPVDADGAWDVDGPSPTGHPADWDLPTTAEALAEQGIDLSSVLPARDAFLAASGELWSALASAGMVGAASTSSSSSSGPPGPAIAFAPALAMDLDGVDTRYEDDYALVLDVGGDDLYDNNAGGNTVLPPPGTAIVSRDPCLILRADPSGPAVEVGSHTAAVLLDAAGNDRYGDPTAPRSCGATGGAAQGVGILLDGGGSDAYHGDNIGVNGGGFTGLGLIADAGGNDRYLAGLPSFTWEDGEPGLLFIVPIGSFGTNGAGAAEGLGSIVDGSGDDIYRAGVFGEATVATENVVLRIAEVANGGAAGQSLAFMLDRAGRDRYLAGADRVTWLTDTRPATQTARQVNGGVSGSTSFFLDVAGNDIYRAGVREFSWPVSEVNCGDVANICSIWGGETGSNGGAELGTAFLLDADGDDHYISGVEHIASDSPYLLVFAAQDGANGGARAKGVGLLLDLAGDDAYFAGVRTVDAHATTIVHVGGGANGGSLILGHGLLLDADGRDTYVAGIPDLHIEGPPASMNLVRGANGGGALTDSHGLLVDLAGDDGYEAHGLLVENETNNVGIVLNGGVNGGAWNQGQGALIDLDGADAYFARAWGANGAVGGTGQGVCCQRAGAGLLFDAGGWRDRYEDGEGGTGLDRAVPAKGNSSAGLQLDGDQVPVVNVDRATGHATIAAGLAAAGPGDTLIVRPGTYPAVTVGTNGAGAALDGLSLCGVSPVGYGCDDPSALTTIIDGFGGTDPAVTLAADGVTVAGFGLRGASPLLRADVVDSPTVRANRLVMVDSGGSPGVGIRLTATTGAAVVDNAVLGDPAVGGVGVRIVGGSGARVEGNAFAGATTSVTIADAVDATVRENVIDATGADSLGVRLSGGSGHRLEGNVLDGPAVGLLVASARDVASRSDRFLGVGTGIRLSAPGVVQPTGFAVHGAGLAGATTALHLAGEPGRTVGLQVDAECNDWGAYQAALIAARIVDDGLLNEVDYDPWISADGDGVGCLVPPTAAFDAAPDPAARGETVAFTDESTAGSRPIVKRTWRFGDGTEETILADDGSTTHAYDAVGSYTATLTVEDLDGMVATTSEVVEVENLPPVLDTVNDLTVPDGHRVRFDVSASDADGDPVTLSATDLPDGATFVVDGTTGTFDWTPMAVQAGDHTVAFHAADPFEAVTETVTITVSTDGAPPVVELLKPTATTLDGEVLVVVGEEVPLRGFAEDLDGSIASAAFHPDGPGSPAIVATPVGDGEWVADPLTFASPGDRTVIFVAEDATGLTAEDARPVRVVDNEPPTARAAKDPVRVDEADPRVVLDGGPSTDPEGRPLTFEWALSTGETIAFPAQVWHVPEVAWSPPGAGAYAATLTVWDHVGLADQTTVEILVDDALAVTAASDPVLPGPAEAVRIVGTVVDEAGDPVENADILAEVVHTATGHAVDVEGTTGPDGSFELGPFHDVDLGVAGVNLRGVHAVTVTASAPNTVDHEAEPAELEVAEATFTYRV